MSEYSVHSLHTVYYTVQANKSFEFRIDTDWTVLVHDCRLLCILLALSLLKLLPHNAAVAAAAVAVATTDNRQADNPTCHAVCVCVHIQRTDITVYRTVYKFYIIVLLTIFLWNEYQKEKKKLE